MVNEVPGSRIIPDKAADSNPATAPSTTVAVAEHSEEEIALWSKIESLALRIAENNLSAAQLEMLSAGKPFTNNSAVEWTKSELPDDPADLKGLNVKQNVKTRVVEKDTEGRFVLREEIDLHGLSSRRYASEPPAGQGGDKVTIYIHYGKGCVVEEAMIIHGRSAYKKGVPELSGTSSEDLYALRPTGETTGKEALASAVTVLEQRGVIKPIEPAPPVSSAR
ncbi:MAG: hypothetical protein ABH816_03630 [Candidatus Levyibacteriota bacterium]